MAEDVVIARFRADLDQVRQEFDEYIQSLEKVQKEEKDTQTEVKKTGDVAAQTAKKRNDSLKGTTTELNKVQNAAKGAFNQKPVTEFNRSIDKTKDNVKGLGSSFSGITQSIKGSLLGIGAGIAAAFSIQAVLDFGKQSINAFLDAEKNAEKLRFAITTIGGESEAAFNKLIKQSADVQKISIFSDDSIQQAQAALSAFGLTSAEIDKLIPKLADFATVAGVDIAQAAEQVGAGLEGAGREFKKYGIEVSATATRQENLNQILGGFDKFAGSAEAATKTLSGELAQLNNRADDLQESVGSRLAATFVKARIAAFEFAETLLKVFTIADEAQKSIDDNAKSLARTVVEEDIARRIRIQGITEEIAVKEKVADIDADLKRNLAEQVKAELRDNRQRVRELIAAEKSLSEQRQAALDFLSDFQNKKNKEAEAGNKKAVNDIRQTTSDNIRQLEDITDTSVTALERIYLESLKGIQSFRSAVREEQQKSNKETVSEFEDTLDELNRLRVEASKETQVGLPEVENNRLDAFLKENAEIISASQDLVNTLTSLYQQLSQNQIDAINKAKEAELTAIDSQITANNEALDKRRISATEAELTEKRLLAEKVKAEAEADKKIREIKRKQAIADKAASLIQITINTARAVSEAIAQAGIPGIALAAVLAALGAAQAAIVVAQPIPYKKGTKSAKGGLSLVGEEGPELTMLPANSKVVNARSTAKYSKIIDAMQDDKFEDYYVLRTDITKELEKQKRTFAENQEKSFAKNISQSMVYQMAQGGKGDFYLERMSKQGLPMSNVEQLASAIASKITQDIYRR